MAGEDDMELVAIFRAEDEATPVIESMREQFSSLDRAAGEGFEATGRGAGAALGHVSGLHRGLGGLATILRITGQEGAAHMVHLAGAVLRVGNVLRSLSGAGAGGLGGRLGIGALGGPAGLALVGGLAIGGIIAAALLMSQNQQKAQPQTIQTVVNVDARGTATEHRALADLVAKEVEARVATRARFAGVD